MLNRDVDILISEVDIVQFKISFEKLYNQKIDLGKSYYSLGFCFYLSEIDEGYIQEDFPDSFDLEKYKYEMTIQSRRALEISLIPFTIGICIWLSQELNIQIAIFSYDLECLICEIRNGKLIGGLETERIPYWSWRPPAI